MSEQTSPAISPSKGREVKLPGPDHPIAITAAAARVRILVGSHVIADSTHALRLEEQGHPPVFYIPRADADMSLLERTTHYTYCPYKGDCTYFNIPLGGPRSEYAVWSYEHPYSAMEQIRGHLAFYPARVDAIEITPVAD